MKEAMFYERLERGIVRCHLCSHRCRIHTSKRGICGVRENREGTLYTLVFGRLVSRAIDPIEKKPLFHFLPGSSAYSIATVGCNLRCKNCQNWEISQSPKPERPVVGSNVPPNEIVEDAERSGCESIAYTYTEPVVFMEYAYETAKLAVDKGIKNLFVTNGYITEEALKVMAPYLHAVNIDLKSFSDKFYRENCGARLEHILKAIELHKKSGIWIEITTLIIPKHNDSVDNLKEIARFIKDLDIGIPWHVSSFYPNYQLSHIPPTPIETIRKARKIGLDLGLRYVYQGNVPGEGEDTYCYNCGALLVERYGYRSRSSVKNARCQGCSAKIDGVWR